MNVTMRLLRGALVAVAMAACAAPVVGCSSTPAPADDVVDEPETTDDTAPIAEPPPAPQAETPGPAPSPTQTWVAGTWRKDQGKYVWTKGSWRPKRAGYAYEQPRW